jgi:hypothetical protein
MRFTALAAPLIALLALAGCGGGGSSCSSVIAVSQVPPPTMLSPAAGTIGLPSTVTVEINYEPPSATLRAVAQGTGATVDGTAFTAAPAGTSPTSAVVSTLFGLAAHTTYTVYVDAVYPSDPCPRGGVMGAVTYNLGNLSTQ